MCFYNKKILFLSLNYFFLYKSDDARIILFNSPVEKVKQRRIWFANVINGDFGE